MKLSLFSIVISLLLACLVQSKEGLQRNVFEMPEGTWSQFMSGPKYSNGAPSQYFLCGFQFQQLKWCKRQSCDCLKKRMRWFTRIFRQVCKQCTNCFQSMTGKINLHFCHYSNWHDQIVKQIGTPNPSNAMRWRQAAMCQKNQYASAIGVYFGYQRGTHIGLNGLRLRCSPATYEMSNFIESSRQGIHNLNFPGYGKFISRVSIKQVYRDKLVGIITEYEPMAIIKSITQMQYINTNKTQQTSIVLQDHKIINCNKQNSQSQVQFKKPYQSTSSFNIEQQYIVGYKVSKKVNVVPPNPTNKARNINQIYGESVEPFSFNRSLTRRLESKNKVIMIVHPKRQGRMTTLLEEIRGTLKFKAKVQLAEMLTQIPIGTYNVSGQWKGVTTSSIVINLLQSQINCQKAKEFKQQP